VAKIITPADRDNSDTSRPRLIAGRYVVDQPLGVGGAAVVYLARDTRYDRQVAIKILKPEVAHAVGAERFIEEILITARLQHPHLLAILDSGETEGLPFYVTPYLEGGSLRARLERERQLPLEDALSIAREVADALAYAHSRGIIHRDIKPDNVLFSGTHACLADFGIAHALERAGGDRLTSTGIVVGTPAYMSPEQAAGDRTLDERSDLYSLGCMLYEMLAGVAPFTGPNGASVIAQRFAFPPRPLRAYRASLPEHVEVAISHAMATAPADRTRSAAEFAAELGTPVGSPSGSIQIAHTHRGRVWRKIAVTAGVISLGTAMGLIAVRSGFTIGSTVDPTRYALLPVVGTDVASLSRAAVTNQLYAALRRWKDLSLVDLETSARAAEDDNTIRAIAHTLGAGRLVRAALTPTGDSVTLRATLYDGDGAVLREAAVFFPANATRDGGWYRHAATALLRVADPPPDADDGDAGTNRLDAWHAYTRAHRALGAGDLDVAQRELTDAVTFDPEYAVAQLWLAQVGAWRHPDDPSAWRDVASRALATAKRVSPRDSLHAAAIQALGNGRYDLACGSYRRMLSVSRTSVPWFGLAQCQGYDPIVVRDARSRSGWAFRGSYRAAVEALDSAVAHTSTIPDFAFLELGTFLFAQPSRVRMGYAAGAPSEQFAAYPSLHADTLGFVPYPVAALATTRVTVDRTTLEAAVRVSTEQLVTRLTEWSRRAPRSALARTLLSLAQEARGDREAAEGGGPAALTTLAEARRLSTDPHEQLQLAAATVRLLVKDAQFVPARLLADSLLSAHPTADGVDAGVLAGLAALTGKVDRTGQLLRIGARDEAAHSEPGMMRVPAPVAEAAATYTALAALGVCSDSLRRMPNEIEALLERQVAAESREAVRVAVLATPASLAVPCVGPAVVSWIPPTAGRLIRMQQALARRETAAIRANLDTLRRARRANRPGDVALDFTWQEAWLLAAIGDTAAAIRHLDLPLNALETLGTQVVNHVPQAAAVGRAMAWRAELARATGDTVNARRWAMAVGQLWATASSELQPLVRHMNAMATGTTSGLGR
jgi:hypothetical protein